VTFLCRLRAFFAGECGCTYHVFSRVLDELIADEEARQAGMRVRHTDGAYR